MPDLPDLIGEALDVVWRAAVDAAHSPDFADDDAARERYRRAAIAEARDMLVAAVGGIDEPERGQRVSEHLDLSDPYRWPGRVVMPYAKTARRADPQEGA